MRDRPVVPNLGEAVRRATRVELPKRFYKEATVESRDGAFAVLLDGRPVRTPAKQALAVASAPLAEAIADEWRGQGERIDPATMPLTRIVNVAIDRVAEEMPVVGADIVKYAASDLLCYRADGPDDLVARQETAWSPLIAWARETLGARFMLAEGIVHVAQDQAALLAIERALEPYDALQLAALHVITTLTGSAIIALSVARGWLSAEQAWQAASVDEDWQMERWGRDEVALAAREARWHEMRAAAQILAP